MDKTAIKNFAVWARKKLIADIMYKAGLIGVSEEGISQPLPQSSKDLQFFDIGTKDYAKVAGAGIEQRKALVRTIRERERTSDYKTAFQAVIEEVAYTWFNRLIAIRFMEVNEYLPSRIRVLSSENPGKNEPDFVTNPFDNDMKFTVAEQDRIMQLKDENKLDELFRMLFIKQCNKLHEILPELFEETNNYTELLLSIDFTDRDGVVYHLVHDIPEKDFNVEKEGQVEIIGWMYQYYNTEPKDETFALLKKNVKITKERIPAATQLFTPDWIVRYMIENSLGRLWIEGHPNDNLKENWKYYLEEAEQETDVQAQLEQIRAEYRNLNPEDIKVIDPCMGSGHILVYCFDVLMQIYESQGYTQRDAAQSVLENNLFGLDIDKRAAQLAYFAVLMKARQYDRRIFTRGIKPHVYAIEESNGINREQLKYFGANLSSTEWNKANLQIGGLLDTFDDAKEYGSILNVENYEWELLQRFAESVDDEGQISLDTIGIDDTKKKLVFLSEIGCVMANKYDVVVTNPPYMGANGMSTKLSQFVKDNYPDTKSDMSTICMEKTLQMCKANGYMAMINIPVWMFLSSYEKLRSNILRKNTITNMVHPGRGIFGSDFGTTSFVIAKTHIMNYRGAYRRLFDKQGEVESIEARETAFFAGKGYYLAQQENYFVIPGAPIAYWLSNNYIQAFENPTLDTFSTIKVGLQTGDNNRFLRQWFECSYDNIYFNCTSHKQSEASPKIWYPYNKGGEYRKWYGNNDYVVNWNNDGYLIKNFVGDNGKLRSRPQNTDFYFRKSITYSYITSGVFNARIKEAGFIFDVNGASIFPSEKYYNYILGLLCSCLADGLTKVINPTISLQTGDIAKIPVKVDEDRFQSVSRLVDENIEIAKADWDSFETSWDFTAHPLVLISCESDFNGDYKTLLKEAYAKWENLCNDRFNKLKANEEELNRIFIDIYSLQDELNYTVDDKDVSVRKADLNRDIRGLLSYSVGCILGRYSLDEKGIAFAGNKWDDSKYNTFVPDKDNCLPITDETYFEDDIVGQFVAWLKTVFGEDTLEANLEFIAKALGNKGTTSRDVIRNYFLNDFMKDHIKIYQKRPIYWLFDSGKQDGFKALVYMHRWSADTVGNLRVEYLHKMQHIYEREIVRMQETIDNSRDSREVSKAAKRKDKLQKQLKETKDYDAMLAHIALSRIEIDLDDGVKANYEKVQTGRDGKKMQILAKI